MTAFTPERVDRYRQAEDLWPDARQAELQSFRDYLGPGTGRCVLELGSGNGTLTTCLRQLGWTVDTVDIAFQAPPGARGHYRADIADGLGFLPNHATYDAVVSLAVLHHVVSSPGRLPAALAKGIAAATKPGGLVMLQDVPAPFPTGASGQFGAPDALDGAQSLGRAGAMNTVRIFAELVDTYSVPTHNGVYLQMAAIARQFADEFTPLARFYHRCDWHFPNRDAAARYVQALFNLNLTPTAVADALAANLREAEVGTALPWALDCLVMRRR